MKAHLITLLLIFNLPLYGQLLQGYCIQPINSQDALPTKQVNCIFQDKEGYVWFGTAEGLCRYDGYSLKTYKSSYLTPNVLNGNIVNCITEDNRGRLWIGTTLGLTVFDKRSGSFRQIDYPPLCNNFVNTLFYSGKDQLWIGTENGLFLYNEWENTFRVFLTDAKDQTTISGNRVRAICEATDGNLWIGVWSNGLCYFNTQTYTFTRYPSLCSRNCVTSILCDEENKLWLGAWAEGVYFVENANNPETVKYHRMDKNTRYEKLIYSFIRSDKGEILVGTGLGMEMIKETASGRTYHNLDEESILGMPNCGIRNLYSGANDIIWMATQNNGVYMLFKEKRLFTNYEFKAPNGLTNSLAMNAFLEWGDDILIGVDNVGLVRFTKEGRMIPAQEDRELQKIPFPMGNVKCMTKSPDGSKLILGSEYGSLFICHLQGQQIVSGRQYWGPETTNWVLGIIVSAICYDKDQNLWIGTDRGLNIITATKDTLSYGQNELGKTIFINSMLEDSRGRIWIGTDADGMILVDSRKGIDKLLFKEYNIRNAGIPINKIECIYEDSRHRLWVGTNGGGLCLYNEKTDCFERVRGINEFSGDAILSIVEYGDFLFMGTYQGLLQYNPDAEEGHQLIVFTVADGLTDNAFSSNAVMAGRDGRLYFGTTHGFLSFHPDDYTVEKEKRQLVFSEIKLFHNSIDQLPSKALHRLSPDGHPSYSRKITLSHNDYHFGIEFATLSYKHPEKNRYAYKLEGFDKDWNYVNAQNRSVYYTNLKSGKYRFMVMGSTENSYMHPEPQILEIEVLPPPYLSWWAFLVYSLLLVLIICWVIRSVRYRTKIKMQEFAHNEELAQEKIQFFTNISHELLTPLTIINCSVEELQRKYNDYGKNWNAIKGNIFRLNRLLEQILEFRKAEKGKLQLTISFGDIGAFVTGLCERYFAQYSNNRHMEFVYESVPRHIPAWFDKSAIDMIVYNLVSNAFKYNDKNGKVHLSIKAEGKVSDHAVEYVSITVGNTGHGFAAEQASRLFGQFQQFQYAGYDKSGNGIGLFLVKSLTELHRGEIRVESTPDVWTEFTVRIPVEKSFYNDIQQEQPDVAFKEAESMAESSNLAEEETNPQEGITVLLIEDDHELLSSLSNLLKANYHVLTASRGDDGYNIALEENPDLIISDVLLPGINGFDLCARFKNELETSHIPIVLLTAKITAEDQRQGYNSGADAYITKPFDFNVMVSQIESILKNRRLITERFKATRQSTENLRALPEIDQAFLEKAIAVVEAHIIDPDFDRSVLHAEMNLSKSTLYRKLKAITDLGPNEFIRNIRLKKSRELLEQGKYNVSEIAYMVGFNDAKYFTSCFKREFNKTPSEYQAHYQIP
ncbi:MAG: response regulator [Bacteroides sp.]|nr:response regulator [Bacteroides sp.]